MGGGLPRHVPLELAEGTLFGPDSIPTSLPIALQSATALGLTGSAAPFGAAPASDPVEAVGSATLALLQLSYFMIQAAA